MAFVALQYELAWSSGEKCGASGRRMSEYAPTVGKVCERRASGVQRAGLSINSTRCA